MVNKISNWTFVAFIPATFGTIFAIIATSSHYWIDTIVERRTGVSSMGLWEICFSDNFAAPWHVHDDLGRRYGDCNWLLSNELRSLRRWLFPSWFIGVVVIMTMSLVLQLLSLVFQVVYLLHGCFLRDQHLALLASAITAFLAGMLVATATILYGWYAGYDTRWIPYPDANRLSWSYGISVCGGLLAIIASFIEFVDFLRLHIVKVQEKREETYAPSVLSNVRY